MPDIKLKARIQNKYKTLAGWNELTAGQFVPLKGEVCYAIDNNTLYQKIGDGTTDFVDLPWLINQADHEENDVNSPAYIKNRLAYEHQDEVERDYAIGQLYIDSIIPVPENAANVENLAFAQLDDEFVVSFSQEQWEDPNTEFIFEIDGANGTHEFTFSSLMKSPLTVDGMSIYGLGNTQAINLIAEELIGAELFSDIEETHTLDYGIAFMAYVDIDSNTFVCVPAFVLLDIEAYPGITGLLGDYDGYDIRLAISKEIIIKQIDDKFIDQAQADFMELDVKSKAYIKNRPGTVATYLASSQAAAIPTYEGELTFNGVNVLGNYGIKSESVSKFIDAGALSQVTHCDVTINGDTFYNCPVFQRHNKIFEIKDPGNDYIIGNPKLISDVDQYLVALLASYGDNMGAEIVDEEDNGLPFAFGITDNGSERPISDGSYAIFNQFTNSRGSVKVKIVPTKLKLAYRPIDKVALPSDKIIGVYNSDKESVMLNGAYEASGTDSLATGYYTRAKGAYSTALNYGTTALGEGQCVVGRFNEENENALFIVGNGGNDVTRSTAFSVGTSSTNINTNVNISEGHNLEVKGDIILASPNGTRYRITVNDDGTLSTIQIY